MSDEEVERLFAEMLLTLGLPFDKVEAMLALPIRKKRALLAEHMRESGNQAPRSRGVQSTPEFNLHALQSADIPSLQELRRLRVELSAAPPRWVQKFIEIGGAIALVRIMNELHDKSLRGNKKKLPIAALLEECVRCLHYLLREVSLATKILEAPKATRAVVLCLRFAPYQKNASQPSKVFSQSGLATLLRILCLMCILPGLHAKILDELMLIRENQKKKSRFANILLRLTDRAVGLDSRVEYMTLINAMVNAPEDVWARAGIRKQLNGVGMKEALKVLKAHPPSSVYEELDLQISVYEDEARADEKQLSRRRGAGVFVPVKDVELTEERKSISADDVFGKIIHEATQRGQLALLMPILSELLRMLQSGARLDNITLGGLLASLGGGLGSGFGAGNGGSPGLGGSLSNSSKPLERKPDDSSPSIDDAPLPPPPPGVPPPPPLPGGKKAAAPPPIPVPEPKVKMRPLHWTKVNQDNTKGTVFEDIGRGIAAEDLKISWTDLEGLFAAAPSKEMKKGKSQAVTTSTKVQLLSQKTGQNLGTLRSRWVSLHCDANSIVLFSSNLFIKIQACPA